MLTFVFRWRAEPVWFEVSVLLVVSLLGCGRVHFSLGRDASVGSSFDARSDTPIAVEVGMGSADSGSLDVRLEASSPTPDAADDVPIVDASPDARPLPRFVATLRKESVTAPILRAPGPAASDCGQFLVTFNDNNPTTHANSWAPTPTAFGGHVLFALPCKYGDSGGWLLGAGTWNPATPATPVVWFDGDGARIGINELVGPGETLPAPDSRAISSTITAYWVETPGNTLLGHFVVSVVGDTIPSVYRVAHATPETFSPTAVDVATRNAFELRSSDSTFRGATATKRSIVRSGSAYWVYTTTWAEPDRARFFIVATPTTDLATPSSPGAPILMNWFEPHVWVWNGTFHMIARRASTNSYHYLRGTSATSFDEANAVPLRLDTFQGAPGAWDEPIFAGLTGSNDPHVAGVVCIEDLVYVFYLAGQFEFLRSVTLPYNKPRGVGVLVASMI